MSADIVALLDRALRRFWHPVCTLRELAAAGDGRGCGPMAVTLLGEPLAVALLPDGPIALRDRCLHRSTRLSVGFVDESAGGGAGALRCAYHGWAYAGSGRCVECPALGPGAAPPPRARVDAFAARLAYGLVWVCLDAAPADAAPTDAALIEAARTAGVAAGDSRVAAASPLGGTGAAVLILPGGPILPACPALADPSLKVLAGDPYTWPTSAPRRVENFVDLSHFAWVHDRSLGRRDDPLHPVPVVERAGGELRFGYDPPDLETSSAAMYGRSAYRIPMPLTVNIEFHMPGGVRRTLWMTASPVTSASCRTFWMLGRNDDLDDASDERHMEFQRQILREDERVVTQQAPPEMVLDAGFELSLRTDRVSIEYRRWLRELACGTEPQN